MRLQYLTGYWWRVGNGTLLLHSEVNFNVPSNYWCWCCWWWWWWLRWCEPCVHRVDMLCVVCSIAHSVCSPLFVPSHTESLNTTTINRNRFYRTRTRFIIFASHCWSIAVKGFLVHFIEPYSRLDDGDEMLFMGQTVMVAAMGMGMLRTTPMTYYNNDDDDHDDYKACKALCPN